jgi:Ser-tRNA(Ala) deacylase AlaX
MRVHTGGHLVDFALFRLGLVPVVLKPLKGDHGKKPFVLYEGSLAAHPELNPHLLTQAVAELIREERKLSWEFAPLEKLQSDAIYLQPGLPTHKPLRKLTLDGVGSVADGGTLVRNTAEVGSLTVIAIDEKDGQVKVSYQL